MIFISARQRTAATATPCAGVQYKRGVCIQHTAPCGTNGAAHARKVWASKAVAGLKMHLRSKFGWEAWLSSSPTLAAMTTPADREAFLREEIKKVEAENEQLKLELAQANDADKASIREDLRVLNKQRAAFAESYAALGMPQMRLVRACARHGLAAC